jgi:hypothetical protein
MTPRSAVSCVAVVAPRGDDAGRPPNRFAIASARPVDSRVARQVAARLEIPAAAA